MFNHSGSLSLKDLLLDSFSLVNRNPRYFVRELIWYSDIYWTSTFYSFKVATSGIQILHDWFYVKAVDTNILGFLICNGSFRCNFKINFRIHSYVPPYRNNAKWYTLHRYDSRNIFNENKKVAIYTSEKNINWFDTSVWMLIYSLFLTEVNLNSLSNTIDRTSINRRIK